MKIIEWHIEGNIKFMLPLSILLIVLVVLFIRFVIKNQNNGSTEAWLIEGIRQIGYFCFFYGLLGQIIGLINAFDALEESAMVISQQIIAGGLKISFYATTYGLIILLISQVMVFYATRISGREVFK